MSNRGTFIPPLPQQRVVSQGFYDTSREKLRRTARYQRWVLLALLADIGISGIVLAHEFEWLTIPSGVPTVLGIMSLAMFLFMTVAIVLMSKQFWHIAVVVICGLLMWVPGVSLITLLVVNWKATRYLQQFGINVGLLGADYKRI